MEKEDKYEIDKQESVKLRLRNMAESEFQHKVRRSHPKPQQIGRYRIVDNGDGTYRIHRANQPEQEGYLVRPNPFRVCNSTICQVKCRKCPKDGKCAHFWICECQDCSYKNICKHCHIIKLSLYEFAKQKEDLNGQQQQPQNDQILDLSQEQNPPVDPQPLVQPLPSALQPQTDSQPQAAPLLPAMPPAIPQYQVYLLPPSDVASQTQVALQPPVAPQIQDVQLQPQAPLAPAAPQPQVALQHLADSQPPVEPQPPADLQPPAAPQPQDAQLQPQAPLAQGGLLPLALQQPKAAPQPPALLQPQVDHQPVDVPQPQEFPQPVEDDDWQDVEEEDNENLQAVMNLEKLRLEELFAEGRRGFQRMKPTAQNLEKLLAMKQHLTEILNLQRGSEKNPVKQSKHTPIRKIMMAKAKAKVKKPRKLNPNSTPADFHVWTGIDHLMFSGIENNMWPHFLNTYPRYIVEYIASKPEDHQIALNDRVIRANNFWKCLTCNKKSDEVSAEIIALGVIKCQFCSTVHHNACLPHQVNCRISLCMCLLSI